MDDIHTNIDPLVLPVSGDLKRRFESVGVGYSIFRGSNLVKLGGNSWTSV